MKSIMVVGTTSHAGKSSLVTALCRLLWRKGWYVTPFKGQNMALNSYVTATGGEIGYAQALQAWSAKTIPRVEMNPILLKPQGNMTSQVIMKGQIAGVTNAKEYYRDYFETGWEAITESLDILGQEFDLVVCEGAGSPAEINLKHRDLTNMRVAKHLNAPTILVADIERGGVFAHIVGTLALLDPHERSLIKGIVINKFRGDKTILDPGIEWLEDYTKIPVLGVIPWFDSALPSEDSLGLLDLPSRKKDYQLKISIIKLPHISNFTDFDPLEAEESVLIEYVQPHQTLGYPDAVIIPGTKTTIADLIVLEKSGMKAQIREYMQSGGTILGICGGFQMLGNEILDPHRLESLEKSCEGLNLLPITTTLKPEKITRQREVAANYPQKGLPVDGYEIHQGYTEIIPHLSKQRKIRYFPLFSDATLGLVDETQSLWGCYLHGVFDNGSWRRAWLNNLRQKRGLSSLPTGISNYRQQREELLDSLADLVETHLNLDPILPINN
ncbi:MAG: cobyric acid synthase CobQ [Cyanobacteria bacterium]|nr:cobyric acid synthase CobQ [Cyanobacteria bacterium CG_2015-22_32_23]NCQ04173.1 cobyric acid synthase CobQ [Cyanobacteria bacterium CG_2015-09_32_10]NCQ40735.1 cobyric acid synthase CobQ [Cyanobacteria bacterium CG_2015-04_32_10]NCS85944.1 cobyric acid synthase CobQ [Cyanobacteria bacterium CG_2015-02_32_10]